MTFYYSRTVRFQDTDAAGVVYFATVLSMCHEAYEASLLAAGTDLQSFFTHPQLAVPIVHADIDFFRPMICGRNYQITVKPVLVDNSKFEINYDILQGEGEEQSQIGRAKTKHVCIRKGDRTKVDLPTYLMQWIQQWTA